MWGLNGEVGGGGGVTLYQFVMFSYLYNNLLHSNCGIKLIRTIRIL